MNKPIRRGAAWLGALIITGGMLILSGCTTPTGEGFAIYLTRDNIPPAQMEALSHVDIAEEPVIAEEDIITYNAQSHEIELTESAYERIANLEVPVQGKSFLVCIDKAPIYWGAFWVMYSSLSFDGITIWKPLTPDETHIIALEPGYPSSSFYRGDDPRSKPEILESLEQSGKLINKLTIETVDKLPESMKGYELYSWEEKGEWHFTLITGTNRNKTMEEILYGEDAISETGWVQIHATGTEAIKTALSKLPEGEDVFWSANWRFEEEPPEGINFTLPPEPDTESIKEHAEKQGLKLFVENLKF